VRHFTRLDHEFTAWSLGKKPLLLPPGGTELLFDEDRSTGSLAYHKKNKEGGRSTSYYI